MYELLPFKLGIEIECTRSLANGMNMSDENLKRFFNVDKILIDLLDPINGDEYACEHRIRIIGYKQIAGLYRILQAMKEHCLVNVHGGLHIHVDFSDCKYNSTFLGMKRLRNKPQLVNFFDKHVKEAVQFFDYKGIYSPHRATSSKDGVISMREETVEFRLGNCTFEYEKIIKWCIYVSQLSKAAKRLVFNKRY